VNTVIRRPVSTLWVEVESGVNGAMGIRKAEISLKVTGVTASLRLEGPGRSPIFSWKSQYFGWFATTLHSNIEQRSRVEDTQIRKLP
jgi:hypothetical protein